MTIPPPFVLSRDRVAEGVSRARIEAPFRAPTCPSIRPLDTAFGLLDGYSGRTVERWGDPEPSRSGLSQLIQFRCVQKKFFSYAKVRLSQPIT